MTFGCFPDAIEVLRPSGLVYLVVIAPSPAVDQLAKNVGVLSRGSVQVPVQVGRFVGHQTNPSPGDGASAQRYALATRSDHRPSWVECGCATSGG
jgi:hypothetical protein